MIPHRTIAGRQKRTPAGVLPAPAEAVSKR
jgi:hypothetical protein